MQVSNSLLATVRRHSLRYAGDRNQMTGSSQISEMAQPAICRGIEMVYRFKTYKRSEILRNHLHMGGANPDGERIDVTSLYLERGGKPWLVVMGEYHFSRDARENWYQELCKMKAGGITVVATYLFWIYHEEEEGVFDFRNDRDIRTFIQEAARAGLDVIIRIGPWAHGECRNGGFPDWLLKKPFRLRDNNPEYMEKARIWYEKIYEQVEGLFYKDGGNIIGIQLENELVDGAEHLFALKQLALEIGFEAPLYTVTGWNAKYGAKIPVDDTLPVFAAYVEAPWAGRWEKLPLSPHFVFHTVRNDAAVGADLVHDTDESGWRLPYERYPFATCELGAGLQSTHHRRIVVSGMDAYALSLVKLGCGNNLVGYYMYHGGTNKIGKLTTLNETRDSGYPNDYPILNYDFHTALSQYGETREQYGLLNLLHLFLNDFGPLLAPMEYVGSLREVGADDRNSLRYCMRTDGKGGFVFINHYQRLAELEDMANVVIDTGNVVFPEIDVKGKVSFFLPFHLDLDGSLLEYATAQLLCRSGNTWFFAAVNGITPQYKFRGKEAVSVQAGLDGMMEAGEIRIVTLPWEKAVYLRKLDGKIYLGEGCDLYETDGEIRAVQDGDYSYFAWKEQREFVHVVKKRPFVQAQVCFEDVKEPFTPVYIGELELGGERQRSWKRITVTTGEGFIEIPFSCDVAQIYADGRLVADNFYCGEAWRIPAELVYGKESYLVMSEMRDDFYREF